MGTRAPVPSLFDVPFLWCSIFFLLKKIEMTWTRKFRVENSFFRFHNFGWSLPDHVYWSGILVLKKRSKLFELGASRSIPLAVLRRKSFLEKSSKTILEHDELIEPSQRWTRKIGWSKMGINEVGKGSCKKREVGNV